MRFEVENKEPRLLILGNSDSGKSTFLKQLKILYGSGFTDIEKDNAKVQTLTNLLAITEKILNELDDDVITTYYQHILDFSAQCVISPDGFETHVLDALTTFWTDPIIREKYNQLGDVFPHTTAHFFDKIAILGTKDYIMNNEDMLLLRTVTQTVADVVFDIKMPDWQGRMHFYDVSGLKYHRKRWIPYFENTNGIIFVVNIAGYNQVLNEDGKTNRMEDALSLYGNLMNNPLLSKSDIIIFFNKNDLFKVKIKEIPLKQFFPEYTGKEKSSSAAIEYFEKKFEKLVEGQKRLVMTHVTCCTDTKAMTAIVDNVILSLMKKDLGNTIAM
ncbi:guanine nucleotide binding protein, alpha subunit [Globomyces pollinis-pini]|nr:guanine nucleotide binding protein, alpha subunit [Globomyces pollinis-pini]